MTAQVEDTLIDHELLSKYMEIETLEYVSKGFMECKFSGRYLSHCSPVEELFEYDHDEFMKLKEYKDWHNNSSPSVKDHILNKCNGEYCIMSEWLLLITQDKRSYHGLFGHNQWKRQMIMNTHHRRDLASSPCFVVSNSGKLCCVLCCVLRRVV